MLRTTMAVMMCAILVRSLGAQELVDKPWIGGVQVECWVDGRPTPTIFTSQVPNDDLAFATFRDGRRVILFSTRLTEMTWQTQIFIYAHECGHHVLGHSQTYDPPTKEIDADCWAARIVAEQKHMTLEGMRLVANGFRPNPAYPPFYPPGPIRADRMVECYRQAAGG